MNRRKFLMSGATVAAVSTMGSNARQGLAQVTPNPSTYNALIAAHSIAVGNKLYGVPTPGDWLTVNNAASACYAEWTNNGRDAGVMQAAFRISASEVIPANVNPQAVLATMLNYQAKMQLADVNQLLAFLSTNASLIPNVLNTLQASGMSPYINLLAKLSEDIASGLASGSITAASLRSGAAFGTDLSPRPSGPPTGGGGGYSCATDGAACLAVGTAFAVLSVMTAGSIDVLAGAAWAGIALWGGTASAGWGLGHAMVCGF